MWKSISMFLGGALTALLIYLKVKDPEEINVSGDYIEKQKKTDNTKIKAKKGIFGFLKRDPENKAERKRKRVLRKSKK